eukprot:g6889.t1
MSAAARAGTKGAAEVVDALLRAGADEAMADKTKRLGSPTQRTARRTGNRRAGIAGGSTVVGSTRGDWAIVVAKVVRLQEEGIFRTIVGNL